MGAVRDAMGPDARIRIDANGGWSVEQAVEAIAALRDAGLEYVEQPVATVEELAAVRRRVDVPIAADESIRRVEDPLRVVRLGAADIAVLKVQPLGGVRACLRLAEQIGIPVVVSSALESSVGIAAGVALAAALPELPVRLRSRHRLDVQPRPRGRADDPGRRPARRTAGGARPRAVGGGAGRPGDARPDGGSGWPPAPPCSTGAGSAADIVNTSTSMAVAVVAALAPRRCHGRRALARVAIRRARGGAPPGRRRRGCCGCTCGSTNEPRASWRSAWPRAAIARLPSSPRRARLWSTSILRSSRRPMPGCACSSCRPTGRPGSAAPAPTRRPTR